MITGCCDSMASLAIAGRSTDLSLNREARPANLGLAWAAFTRAPAPPVSWRYTTLQSPRNEAVRLATRCSVSSKSSVEESCALAVDRN
jgi:hypothetical protein